MPLNKGEHGRKRILSERSVEAMTRGQLTRDQKVMELIRGYWENHGWGFGLSVVTGPD